MNNKTPEPIFKYLYSEMKTDADRIDWLKQEVLRVKTERNKYQSENIQLKRDLERVSTELKYLENYVNMKKA